MPQSLPQRPWRIGAAGLSVWVRLTPKGGADRIDGLVRLDDGRSVVKARVAAPPEDGKANKALIALLAKQWGCAKSQLTVGAGAAGRLKRIDIAGDGAKLAARLEDRFAEE